MLASLGSFAAAFAFQDPDALGDARRAWAMEFLDGPKVHLELAKAHHDAGRRELAQQICEETRHRFGDDDFDAVYRDVFVFPEMPEPTEEVAATLARAEELLSGEDGGAAAKQLCEEALAKWPRSCELHFELGRAREALGEDADADFAKAAELAPTSPFIQGWVARRLLKRKQDIDAAFEGYLTAYFLDPHFYDTEFAEFRIAEELGPKRSVALYQAAIDAGDFRGALSLDAYWGTERALQKLRKEWQPAFAADAARMLAHDSGEVRWTAMILLEELADESFDPILEKLLVAGDLRVKGLAIYLAVARRGDRALDLVREYLASDCPLLRYDAISALGIYGGDGSEAVLREHAAKESHAVLKRTIESALSR